MRHAAYSQAASTSHPRSALHPSHPHAPHSSHPAAASSSSLAPSPYAPPVSAWSSNPLTGSSTLHGTAPGDAGAGAGASSGQDRVASASTALDRVLAMLDGFEDDMDCPLCLEEMDLSDLNFKPCPCGYQICRFCYHHIKENLNNRCPACRTPYDDATVEFKAIKPDEMKRLQAAKKLRDKRRKDEALRIQNKAEVRVRQRTQVHIQGMTTKIANEDTLVQLKGPEHFGQYGKILKLFMSKRSATVTQPASSHPHFQPVNVYINYRSAAEASNCIAHVDGTVTPDGHKLKAIWGTTRYCPNYLKGIRCHNENCTLAHEPGEEIEGAGPATKDEIFTYDNETASKVKTVTASTSRKQPEATLPATASWASKDAPRPPSTPIILNPHLPPLSATLPKPPPPQRTISVAKPQKHPLPARPSSRASQQAAHTASANAALSAAAAAVPSPAPSPSPAAATPPPPAEPKSKKIAAASAAPAPPEPTAPEVLAEEPAVPSASTSQPSPAAPPSLPTPAPITVTPEPPVLPNGHLENGFGPTFDFPSLPSFPDLEFGEGQFSFSLNLDVKGKGRATNDGSDGVSTPLKDFANLEGFGRGTLLDGPTGEPGPFSPGLSSAASSYVGSFDPFSEASSPFGGIGEPRSGSPTPPSTAGEDLSRRSSRFGFARRGSSTLGKSGDLVSALARSAFAAGGTGFGRETSPGGMSGAAPFAPPGIGLPLRSVGHSATFGGLPQLSSNENRDPSAPAASLWPSSATPAFPPGVLRSLVSPNGSAVSSPQLSPRSRHAVLPPHPGQQQQQHAHSHYGPPPGISGPASSAANSALPPPPGIGVGVARAPIPAASFPLPPPAPRPNNSSTVAKEDLLALIAAAQASAPKQQQNPEPHPFFSDPAILNARLASSHQPGGGHLDQLPPFGQQQQQQQPGAYPPGMRPPFQMPPHQQHQHQQGPPGMYRPAPPGIGKV
ncbi:hypothetical protein JCM5296_006185 [Sporobolomyces johnsonii]